MKKHEIGISVYPDLRPFDEIEKYLELAGKYGVTRVFSSMFSVEGSNEEILDYFKKLDDAAHQNGMTVSLDVNPGFLKKIGASEEDLSIFHDIGCDIVRMDLCYGTEKDLKLCQNPYGITIQLNASMVEEQELRELKEHGVTERQLMLGHNFYPQRYTGLKWKNFLEINQKVSPYGFPIEAFIASQNENTHGVWDAKDGLPTVERLRDLPAEQATRILFASDHVDNVMFGNAYASEEEFKEIAALLAGPRKIEYSPIYAMLKELGSAEEIEEEKMLKVVLEKNVTEEEKHVLFDLYPQSDFGDSSEWIWRSRMGRFLNSQYQVVPRKEDCEMFEPGSVLIVNDHYKHYSGEVQIARLPIINDGTRNLIGKLAENEDIILDLIRDGDAVKFIAA